MRAWQISLVIAAIAAGGALAAPTKGSKLVLPPDAPPSITITPTAAPYNGAEIKLAKFIRALQAGRRTDAVKLFSSKVGPRERQSFLDKKWLVNSTAKDTNFEKMFFIKDMVIRSTRVFSNGVELGILPRTKSNKRTTGAIPVRMRREHGQWWVEFHPQEAKMIVRPSKPRKSGK